MDYIQPGQTKWVENLAALKYDLDKVSKLPKQNLHEMILMALKFLGFISAKNLNSNYSKPL